MTECTRQHRCKITQIVENSKNLVSMSRLSTSMLRIFPFFPLFALAAVIPVGALSAQETADERGQPSLEGAYNDWSLYGMQDNGNPVCYLSSGLERSSDNVPRKRPAVVLITNRPAEKRKGVVSVDPGYIYEDGSQVLMSIGRRQFRLYTKGGQA